MDFGFAGILVQFPAVGPPRPRPLRAHPLASVRWPRPLRWAAAQPGAPAAAQVLDPRGRLRMATPAGPRDRIVLAHLRAFEGRVGGSVW